MEVTEAIQSLAQGVLTAFSLVFIIPLIGEIVRSVIERWWL